MAHVSASQRSLHIAPIFRLLLKVAVNGTQQCEFFNFCGTFESQQEHDLHPCASTLLLNVAHDHFEWSTWIRNICIDKLKKKQPVCFSVLNGWHILAP